MADRKNIPNYVRFQVFKRDHFTCQYCGKGGGELEVDHIKPVTKGGSNDMDNLITACRDCNRGKSDTSVLPDGYILVRERKSRRLQLLIRPSIYEEVKNMATENNQSVNDYINELIEKEVYEKR